MVEENLENRVEDGRVIIKPNITKGNIVLNQEGDFYLYNVFEIKNLFWLSDFEARFVRMRLESL